MFTSPRTLARTAFYIAVVVTLALLVAGWASNSLQSLLLPGARLVALGRFFGLLAAWSIVLEIILMMRVPFFERNFDLHELVDLHRLNGYAVLLGIAGHVVFLTLGYAAPGHTGLWHQFILLNTGFEDVLLATIGTGIFLLAVGLSVQAARKRLRYEVWYALHLTMYLAILLTFLHQVKTGNDFVGHFWFTAYWYALYGLAFVLWAWYRMAVPLLLLVKHQFRVVAVEQTAHDIYSVVVTGRNVQQFNFAAGQYATWRILHRGSWLEAHPFSFSSPPGGSTVRFTAKVAGDYTRKLTQLQPGALVLIDGPRGSFSAERAAGNPHVVLIAGGIGVAPYLSTIGELLAAGKNVTLLYAARNSADIAFVDELTRLRAAGLHIRTFIGDAGQRIDQTALQAATRMNPIVYICGPDGMSRAFVQTLKELGLPKQQIVTERFAF